MCQCGEKTNNDAIMKLIFTLVSPDHLSGSLKASLEHSLRNAEDVKLAVPVSLFLNNVVSQKC